jgi:hypothetical protein
MARSHFSIFVSTHGQGEWRVASLLGETGPFSARQQAVEEALRQAQAHAAHQVLVQMPDGTFHREWPEAEQRLNPAR